MKFPEVVVAVAGHIQDADDNFDAAVDLREQGEFDRSIAAHAEGGNAAVMHTLVPV